MYESQSRTGTPWLSSSWDLKLPLQGAQVRSLVREQSSHMLCGMAEKKKLIKKKKLVELDIEKGELYCM